MKEAKSSLQKIMNEWKCYQLNLEDEMLLTHQIQTTANYYKTTWDLLACQLLLS